METVMKWKTDLPTPKYFSQIVIVTLYAQKDNDHWVTLAYIDPVGNFKSKDGDELKYPVVAWMCFPEPYMTNPL